MPRGEHRPQGRTQATEDNTEETQRKHNTTLDPSDESTSGLRRDAASPLLPAHDSCGQLEKWHVGVPGGGGGVSPLACELAKCRP